MSQGLIHKDGEQGIWITMRELPDHALMFINIQLCNTPWPRRKSFNIALLYLREPRLAMVEAWKHANSVTADQL